MLLEPANVRRVHWTCAAQNLLLWSLVISGARIIPEFPTCSRTVKRGRSHSKRGTLAKTSGVVRQSWFASEKCYGGLLIRPNQHILLRDDDHSRGSPGQIEG